MPDDSPSRSAPEPHEISPNSNGAAVTAVAKAPSEQNQDPSKNDDKPTTSRGRSPSHSRSSPARRRRSSSSRSRSRDRRRRRSRSRSRDRRHRRRYSRSRSRDRRRRRSRSRSRDRYRHRRRRRSSSSEDDGRRRPYGNKARMMAVEDPFAKLRSAGAASVDPAQIARQMQEQQLRARQMVLQQQAASAMAAASKPQREVYVGNIIPGTVTDIMLHQLFSATLKAAFPDKCADRDPVVHVNMNPEGKYAFVETISPDLATACLQLNGQVPLGGNMLSIGRPAGYIDPAKAHAAAHAAAEALARFQAESAALRNNGNSGGPAGTGGDGSGGAGAPASAAVLDEKTPFLVADGVISREGLTNDAEYNEVLTELQEEFGRHGTVLRLVMPRSADETPVDQGAEAGVKDVTCGKAFVQFLDAEAAKKAVAAVDGRLFAGQRVEVRHMPASAFMEAVGQKA